MKCHQVHTKFHTTCHSKCHSTSQLDQVLLISPGVAADRPSLADFQQWLKRQRTHQRFSRVEMFRVCHFGSVYVFIAIQLLCKL